ncbi:putative ribonuclease H-like domain-containing protein, partial [Tanacetum coccineum]
QYVLLPFLNFDSQSPKSSEDEGADDARKKNRVLDPAKEDDKSGQEEATNTNSTNRLNTVSLSINTISSSFTTMDPGRERAQRNEFESVFGQDKDANGNNIYRMFTPVNAAGSSCENLGGSIPINAATLPNADLPTDPLMLEDTTDFLNTGIFSGAYNDEYVGAEADFNNLEITINSAQEHAMVSYIKKQRRTNHKDYQNCLFAYFLSQIEPKKVTQALSDPSWIVAMQDELLQIEVIRLFLSYASFMGFIVYEMDVKSAFLYCIIEEEVCVYQPPGFEDPQFLDKVYKVEKALYGLHQDPRAWYETLSTYLFENGFRRGTIDKTLSIKKEKCDILLVQVYVDDIIFGSTKKSLCTEFESVFGQDKDANGNSIYRMFTPVNTAGSSCDNLGGSIPVNAATVPNVDLPTDPLMPEDTTDFLNIGIFSGAYDDEDVGAEADFNNLETTMNVSPIPTTRIQKDHQVHQV